MDILQIFAILIAVTATSLTYIVSIKLTRDANMAGGITAIALLSFCAIGLAIESCFDRLKKLIDKRAADLHATLKNAESAKTNKTEEY